MTVWAGVQRAVRSRRRVVWAAAVLAGGVALAACSSNTPTTSAQSPNHEHSPANTSSTAGSTGSGGSSHSGSTANSGSGSGTTDFRKVLGNLRQKSNATFSVSYSITTSGKQQDVTFAQKPPKQAIVTSNGSIYIDGSSVTSCTTSGGSTTCTQLPSSAAAASTGLTALFSPGVLTRTLQGIEAEVAAHVAGVSITSTSETKGGQASTCVTANTKAEPSGVTYCASNSTGVLTYFSANENSGTLTAYDANPPASTFSPPADATINTLPKGIG